MDRPVTLARARADAPVAIGCALLTLVLLLAAPLAGDDPAVEVPAALSGSWWAGVAVLTVQSAVLLARSASPRLAVVATAVLVPVGAAVGLADATGLTSIPVVVAVYGLAVSRARQPWWPALITAGLLVAAGHALTQVRLDAAAGTVVGTALSQGAGAVLLPLGVGAVVAARRQTGAAREQALLAESREREARLQAAVSHERMAMARELHDIAAHHLSGIAVMTAALGTQIDTDPSGAKVAAAQVREQSRTLLRDLRQLVGLLRDDAPADGLVAADRQQTLDGIGDLVLDAGSAGLSVEAAVLGPAGERLGAGIGPLAQLAAYRIVQESLANVARHAPGATARVTVDDRDRSAVRVTVDNDAPATAPTGERGGFGLVGMRERAELTGATLTYGPTASGGWRVEVVLPREPELGDETA